MTTPLQSGLLFLAAVTSGGLNAVAGGGGLIIFSALLGIGMPPVIANATATMASLPGSIASITAYRRDLQDLGWLSLVFCSVSLVGGTIGARLLLWIPSEILKQLIPCLLLFANLVFTFSPSTTTDSPAIVSEDRRWMAAPIVFFVALYGGFYGLGLSFLLLAILRTIGVEQINQINGLKVLLILCIDAISSIIFGLAGAIDWERSLFLMLGTTLGGYGGAYYARMLNPNLVKYSIVAIGWVMTGYFLLR